MKDLTIDGLEREIEEWNDPVGVALELLRRYRALEAAARPVLALADVAANSNPRSTSAEREALRALLKGDP
jgi:hypothetical protein